MKIVSIFFIIDKKISCKIEQKIRKDIDKRKEYLDRLVEKEKIEAKKAENQNPGPGAYDVKYDYTEDKLPQVKNILNLVFPWRSIRKATSRTSNFK